MRINTVVVLAIIYNPVDTEMLHGHNVVYEWGSAGPQQQLQNSPHQQGTRSAGHRDESGLMRLTMLLLMMKSTRTMYYNNYGSKSNYIILQNCRYLMCYVIIHPRTHRNTVSTTNTIVHFNPLKAILETTHLHGT